MGLKSQGFRKVLFRVLWRYLCIGLVVFPVYGQDDKGASNPTIRPTSSKGIVKVQNGHIDAVRATLDLNYPLGPKLPGRIAAGFSWSLQSWNGVGISIDQTSSLGGSSQVIAPGRIQPIKFQSHIGNPSAYRGNADTVNLYLFGATYTFFPLTAPAGPGTYQASEVLGWLAKRGVQLPTDCSRFMVYSSTDGTSFYVEGYNNTGWIYFQAAMIGDQAVYWKKSEPSKTYITSLWGDRISYSETWSASSPYYVGVLKNELNPGEWIRTEIGDGLGPHTVVPIITPYGNGVDPASIGEVTLPPFDEVVGSGTVRVTNSLGIAETRVQGLMSLASDSYWVENLYGNYAYQDQYYTGIVRYAFHPTSISTQSNTGQETTAFNWKRLASGYNFNDLEITHPSGLKETFYTALDTPLGLWNPDTYFTRMTALEHPDESGFSGFFTERTEAFSNNPMDGIAANIRPYLGTNNNTFGGFVRVTTLDPSGQGQTTLITQVLPRISFSGGVSVPPRNEGTISFPQPQHVTNILTYDTAQINYYSSFRGVRLVHAGGKTWSVPGSRGTDAYLFFSSAILEAQEIHGSGAPYSTPYDPAAMAGAQDWDPSGYTIDRYTRFDGWEFRNWMNTTGNPYYVPGSPAYPVNPVATKESTVTTTSGSPILPVRTQVTGDPTRYGSRDTRGPLRFEHDVNSPSSGTAPNPIGKGVQTPSYILAAQVSGGTGAIQHVEQLTRHWDPSLGKLVEDTKTETLAGSSLSALREGAFAPMELNSTTYLSDSYGRITMTETHRGAFIETVQRQFDGSSPVPRQTTTFLTGPDLASPTFSGQVGKSYVLGPAPHFWVQSETDLLTQRTTTYDIRNIRGQVTHFTDQSTGIGTRLDYDDQGRLAKRTREAHGVVGADMIEYHYSPDHKSTDEIHTIEGRVLTTHTNFDAFGRVTRVVRPDGSTQTSDYDTWGQLWHRSPWLKPGQSSYGTFTFAYDVKGRLVEERDPKSRVLKSYPYEPAWGSAGGQTGVVSSVIDDRGNSLTEIRDLLGQRSAVVDEVGHRTQFTYDSWGNLSTTNNAGQIRRYTYNAMGWLTSRVEPEEGQSTYGNFTVLGAARETHLKGRDGTSSSLLTTELDAKHRPWHLSSALGPVTTYKTITYWEDFSVPKQVLETQPNGSLQEDYSHDDLGRLSAKIVSDGVHSFRVSRTLDAAGNPLRLKVEPGNGWPSQEQTLNYDYLLRPSQAKFNCQPRASMSYDQIQGTAVTQTLSYANGASTREVMDQGELTLTEHRATGGTLLPTGKESNVITWTAGGLMLSRGQDNFSYDPLGRLTYARTQGPNGETVDQWFVFDRFGNRLQSDFAFSSPAGGMVKPDELLAWRASYDARNNLPTQVTGLIPGTAHDLIGAGSVQGTLDVGAQYDNLGRISSIRAIPGLPSSQTAWEYDAGGRVFREWLNGLSSSFLLDGQGLRFKRTKADGSIQFTVYGFDREPLMVLQAPPSGSPRLDKLMVYAFGKLISEESTIGTHYIQGDQVGSPNLVSDENGQVIGHTKNLPFGERFGQMGEKSIRRFTNHEDGEGSAIYMQARTYLPVFGRFAQVDPVYDQKIYSKDSWNLYAYVANNPVTQTDPTGEAESQNIYGPVDMSSGGSTTEIERVAREKKKNEEEKKGTEKSKAQTTTPSRDDVKKELNSLADNYKVPKDVVLAVAQKESNFDTTAVNENKNGKGKIVSTDYGVMQVNSSNIGGTVKGSDGKSFTISDSVKTDWKENAKVGVAMVAQEYKAAGRDQPKGSAETKAQQTYSGYNAGPSGRERYTERNKSGGFADGRDKGFLDIYRSLQN